MNRLGDATWPDVAVDPPLLLVPVGSCEQHGPHLPLDTDTRIAVAIADACAASVSGVAVTPPISIGASGEHAGFAGTLSIGNDVLETLLIELGRSADWSTGLVFVNGHGGNHTAVRAAVETLTAEGRRALAWWPHIHGGDAHAGRSETSLLLTISPELVRLDRAAAGNTDRIATLMPALRDGGVAAVSANGVLGDPCGANAAEGVALLDRLAADLAEAIAAWRTT
ncbi:MAG: mycofactocin biosynthesis peptidyl-dipeptidase MftE [Ilumatobacteraceae bacterium]